VNYYKLRSMLAHDVREFLANYPEEEYQKFVQRMLLKYGCTEKMIREMFASFNLQYQDGEMVKIR